MSARQKFKSLDGKKRLLLLCFVVIGLIYIASNFNSTPQLSKLPEREITKAPRIKVENNLASLAPKPTESPTEPFTPKIGPEVIDDKAIPPEPTKSSTESTTETTTETSTETSTDFNTKGVATMTSNITPWFTVKDWGKIYGPLRVWCCLMSLPDLTDMKLINNTWGKRCDRLMFFVNYKLLNETSSDWEKYNGLDIIPFKLMRGHRSLWEVIWKMINKMNEVSDQFDWIVKIDTDAWFSIPNFKLYAQYFDPNEPWYLGHTLLHLWETGNGTSVGKRCTNVIFNGGAAYALSRKTICKLSRVFHTVEFLEPADPKNCFVTCSDCYSIDGEDYLLGNCLKMIGIIPVDTLNSKNQTKFSLYDYPQVSGPKWPHLMVHPDWFMNNHKIPGLNPANFTDDNMILFHDYKNRTTKLAEFEFLENKYTLISPFHENFTEEERLKYMPPFPSPFKYNLLNNQGESTLFLDEYLNALNSHPLQKLWKGVDNLWNYTTPVCD